MSKPHTRTGQPARNALWLDGVEFRWPGARAFELSIEELAIGRDQSILLLGPSGSGKSTLLSLICGIAMPRSGTIDVLGENLVTMGATARDRFRAEHYGIIFQMFNLLPYASALDNVLLPLSFAPERRNRAAQHRSPTEEVEQLLSALGLDGPQSANAVAAELSVGQQQRVAAARALIGAPEIIVADEPTSALDSETQDSFLDLLFGQVEKAGATLVMVSHDERLAGRFDKVLQLRDIAAIRQGGES